jgi:hypothetical protein
MKLKAFLVTQLQRPLVARALHTFIQAFLAVWLVNGMSLDKVTLTAGVAAGISALKTLLVTYLEGREG